MLKHCMKPCPWFSIRKSLVPAAISYRHRYSSRLLILHIYLCHKYYLIKNTIQLHACIDGNVVAFY